MLDEFRSTYITWDKATRRIYSPITANESDSNGRKLNIQVVNSGQVENLTGATLHLYWETKDKTQHGLDVFDASDISKGEFEIFYTTAMLSNVGELNATLVLVDSTGKVVSDWFKITVARGINESAIESENSFSSLTQALIDISNLEQNYTPRLNDLTAQLQQTEQELNAQLQQTEKKVNFLSPLKLKDENEADFENYVNTSFFSGVTVYTQEGTREIHVCRVGERHGSFNNCLFAYIRLNDGAFYKKRLNLDYSIGDYRDPNLTYFPENKSIYLSISVKKHDETFTNYMIRLDEYVDVVSANEIKGMENHFTWGNSIAASDGKTLRTAYNVATPGGGGVSLFRSGDAPNPFNYTKVLDLFPSSSQNPNECTLSLWGDKLIAITRQNNGNMLYRQTYDLTGLTGWGNIIDLGFVGHAPVIMPRISEGDPLILGYSYGTGEGNYVRRSPHFRLTYDGTNYSEPIVVSHLQAVGGYQSLVPNHNGFGTMYYEDSPTVTSSTNVYYQELDILKLLDQPRVFLKRNRNVLKEHQYRHQNNKFLLGDATKISGAYSSNATNTEMVFEVKREMTVTAVQMYLEQYGSASSTIKLFEDGQLLTESGAVAITTKNTYEFSISATLKPGKRYKLQLTSNVRNFSWHYTHHSYSQIDFGELIYLDTLANGNSNKKHVVPFTLVRTV